MQIHELNRPRRTDEGFMDVVKSAGTALKQSVSNVVGVDSNDPAPSAGILDPVQKLAAVKKNPDMVRIATQYAKEWTASQSKAVPESVTERRVGKKKASRTGILPQDDISGFSKQAQQQIQQQIQAQQQSASPAAPAQPAAPAAPAITPSAQYLKDFLAFANEKIAMRDSTTYRMIGLTDVENSKLNPQLDAAKQAVVAAQGNPIATETAVKNYILTAMAGAQLVASKNKVDNASPKAPAYGQQSSSTPNVASSASAPAPGQVTGNNAVALLNDVGLTAPVLSKAGSAIHSVTGNKQLSKTGDSVIDTMLEGMGYTVS